MEEFTVSSLSNLIKRNIEKNFNNITLKAEVSAPKTQASGHIYFTLKDADAVIDAICWRGVALTQKTKLEDGMEILCTGNVTTYPARSKYQFIVNHFEPSGLGSLLKILEERKKKLQAEGLFDVNLKKPIPKIPRLIGFITSPTGAVIQDMLHRFRQRFPREILLWPVLVQGTEAAQQIADAIAGMNKLAPDIRPDLLIVARGGGSFEDLMPFNEEIVVRAVAASDIPVISAVGHETDTTLIDYASDLRAPTPTAAAEFAVPERTKLHADLQKTFTHIEFTFSKNFEALQLSLKLMKIFNIQTAIAPQIQRVDYACEKITQQMKQFLAQKKAKLSEIFLTVPQIKITGDEIFQRLSFAFRSAFEKSQNRFAVASNVFESNSHMKILQKGFAFAESSDGKPITTAVEAKKFWEFSLTFGDGKIMVSHKPLQENLL